MSNRRKRRAKAAGSDNRTSPIRLQPFAPTNPNRQSNRDRLSLSTSLQTSLSDPATSEARALCAAFETHCLSGWGGRIRTSEWRFQRPLPCHLATPHYLADKDLASRTRTSRHSKIV